MKQVPLIRIVDDDPSVGASFRFVLEAVGYQVRTYESAAEFLDGDDPTREGCMLLDVRMPGLSGPELQTRLGYNNQNGPPFSHSPSTAFWNR